ncbi:HAD-like domain-containing protein [Colletotrichum godetiae]|uniref:HAD-like domain-containing protein n=1 Tax=Colletotrichum godetiae TaxID=1209918 RepID=A0AAJ0ABM3_9PEZI|nr:HAD-like domain-containing protein [Colletotrichum godetiae]KAK1658601.1 HAD-like domain-containing protein [Colletotrichum godetiae]
MPQNTLNLVLDFDGTITTKDTIGTLAEIGLQFQQQRGVDLSSNWQEILQDYSKDHADHVSTYLPIANKRRSLEGELAFLRGLKEVESRSVQRVERSGIFRGISREYLTLIGENCRREGRVNLRDGFAELMDVAKQKGWSVAIVSVNWSGSFIKGVLSDYSVDIVANEIELDGSISGPEVMGSTARQPSLMTCEDKLRALQIFAARQGVEDIGTLVYFGDSTTDIECLLATQGFVISSNAESSLMKTLRRIGYRVPKVEDGRASEGTAWASTFVEVLKSGLLSLTETL